MSRTPALSLGRLRSVAVALGIAVIAQAARAEEPLSTDRPDFVESSDVVGAGRVQIETGYASERASADGLRTHLRTTPTLLRIGLGDRHELRLETDGFARATTTDRDAGTTSRERGMSDLSLGLKWHQRDGGEDGSPALAWLLHVDADTGSPAFRGNGWRPSLRMVAEWELPQDFSVGVMPGVALDRTPEGRRHAVGILAATLGKAWTPRWRSFVEIAGQQLARSRDGGSVVTFDTGATYLVTDDLQLDAAVSAGLNRQSPGVVWGVGLSYRY